MTFEIVTPLCWLHIANLSLLFTVTSRHCSALTEHNPCVVALDNMLKQQVNITRDFLATQRQLHHAISTALNRCLTTDYVTWGNTAQVCSNTSWYCSLIQSRNSMNNKWQLGASSICCFLCCIRFRFYGQVELLDGDIEQDPPYEGGKYIKLLCDVDKRNVCTKEHKDVLRKDKLTHHKVCIVYESFDLPDEIFGNQH